MSRHLSDPAVRQALTGAAAGLVAAFAVDGLRRVIDAEERRQGAVAARTAGHPPGALADSAVRRLGRQGLGSYTRARAGRMLRYGMAAILGATYGTAAEMKSQKLMKIIGLAFGVSLAQTMEQGTLPAPAVRDEPYRYRITFHFYGLVSHLVYAATVETLRRVVWR